MNSLEKFNDLIHDYGLDEKETHVDSNNDSWFTSKFLCELMGVVPNTVKKNTEEIFDWGILDKSTNCKKMQKVGSNKPVRFYSLDVLTQLGMTLRSKPARQFQKRLRNIFKGLVKGELRLINTNNIFNAIENQPTTEHRQRVNIQMINKGLLEADVETRCYNVKLTKALNDLIIEFGYGGYIPHIQREIGKAIYRMYPQEWSELHNITNPHRRRDYCTADQWTVTQFVEKELYKMLIHHDGDVNKRQLFKYVNDCTQRGLGLWELIQENEEIKNHICSNQSSLDEYIVITG